MKTFSAAALVAATLALASPADALTLRLDGFTSSIASVHINAYPGTPAGSDVGATGFNVTDTSGSMGSFVAWCVDAGHWLMGVGQSQTYAVTGNPWSNSDGLTAGAIARIQKLFDSSDYASLDLSDVNVAAGFQIALWEMAFETATLLDATEDAFDVSSGNDVIAAAQNFLTGAQNYAGPQKYALTFLENVGPDDRSSGQNLVTVSELPAVPLPAGGILLVSALAGLGLRRRRRA